MADEDGTESREGRRARKSGPRQQRHADLLKPGDQIGLQLRAFYAAVQDEAIPAHLLDLLEQLDQAEAKASREQAADADPAAKPDV